MSENQSFKSRRRLHGSALLLIFLGIASAVSAVPKIAARSRRAAAHAPSQVLVKFRDGATEGRRRLASSRMPEKRAITSLGVHVVSVPASRSAEEFAAEMRSRYGTDLEYAEPARIRYAVAIPNDPLLSGQYHISKIGCPAAWDSTTGNGITIAIADTGVQTNHPDLSAHLLVGRNVVDGTSNVSDVNGHGTAVAGMAVAVGNNGDGVAGVAYNAWILPIKIDVVIPGDPDCSNGGCSDDSYIAEAIVEAADRGAKVVNVSFNSDAPAPAGCWSQTVLDAASYMESRGGLVVVAAGNGGSDGIGDNKGCTNNPQIINVAATTENDLLTSFSNFGSELDIAAPGENLQTTNCDACFLGSGLGPYASGYDGTSFAAPIVSGVLGLIYATDPAFTPDQAKQVLFHSTTDLGSAGFDNFFGWGRVNAQNAIVVAQQNSAQFQLESLSNVYAYPNPWDARRTSVRQVTITNVPQNAAIKIFTMSGFWVKTLQATSNGRAVWLLNNDADESVASGLYFYTVTTPSNNTKGTIAIIK